MKCDIAWHSMSQTTVVRSGYTPASKASREVTNFINKKQCFFQTMSIYVRITLCTLPKLCFSILFSFSLLQGNNTLSLTNAIIL